MIPRAGGQYAFARRALTSADALDLNLRVERIPKNSPEDARPDSLRSGN